MNLNGLLFCQQFMVEQNDTKTLTTSGENQSPDVLFFNIMSEMLDNEPKEEPLSSKEMNIVETIPINSHEAKELVNEQQINLQQEMTPNEKPIKILPLAQNKIDEFNLAKSEKLEIGTLDDISEIDMKIEKADLNLKAVVSYPENNIEPEEDEPLFMSDEDIFSNPFISQLMQEKPQVTENNLNQIDETVEKDSLVDEVSLLAKKENAPPLNKENPIILQKEPSKTSEVELIKQPLPLKDINSNEEPLTTEVEIDEATLVSQTEEPKATKTELQTNTQTSIQDIKTVTATTKPQPITMPQNIDSSEWGDNFNQQIIWLGQQKIKSALIKLNPENMGHLELNLSFEKEEVKLHVVTEHQHIKDLVELSLPKLKTVFEAEGIVLSDASVQTNQQQKEGSSSFKREQTSLANIEPEEDGPLFIKKQGLVDYFA
nr:flagellar hook-length control protein FliK [Pseudomonadota bacterium]